MISDPTIQELSESSQWIHEIRSIVAKNHKDFFRLNPTRYWFDFLLNLLLAYGFATAFLMLPIGSWLQLAAFPFALFWLYRVTSLVHEVAHLRRGEMTAFKVTWNLLVGIITFSPSPFFTRHHRDHHSPKYFGSSRDPEYKRNMFTHGSMIGLTYFFLTILVTPGIVFLRFLLVPLFWSWPRLREWVWMHASHLSMTFSPNYHAMRSPDERRNIALVEWLCCARALQILLSVSLGGVTWTRLPLLYALGLGVLCLNMLRFMADHHGKSHGDVMEFEEHILDSCNYSGKDILTRIMFPFGIRYHALHHLFPSLPYHQLAAVHQSLSKGLSPQNPYHQLEQHSWWRVAKSSLIPSAWKPTIDSSK